MGKKRFNSKNEQQYHWLHSKDKPCPICGNLMLYRSSRCHPCYIKEMKARSMENAISWKGGRFNDKGRVLLYIPSHPSSRKEGYILRSRLVMEKEIGRQLKPDELVHHLNGIRNDDRPKNLVIVSRHNHPIRTLEKLWQKRIRELEAELAQHFLPLQG